MTSAHQTNVVPNKPYERWYQTQIPALSPLNLMIVTFPQYVNRSSPQGIVAESAKINSNIDEYGKGSKSKSKV